MFLGLVFFFIFFLNLQNWPEPLVQFYLYSQINNCLKVRHTVR